jgi:predicted nucleic acid-binding protein
MLLDTNLIIYAAKPQNEFLRRWIQSEVPAVSGAAYVEALGYHKLSGDERQFLEAFFAAAPMLPLDRPVLDQAVKLRQLRKLSLGDSLVAGTALVHKLTLATHNTSDFAWIPNLTVFDPIEKPPVPMK